MGHRPTDAITGIGRKTRAKLAALGISTVAELAATDEERLAEVLGPTMGPYFRRLGRGGGSAVVDPSPYVPRAHGRETTFQNNLDDWSEVEAAARRLADQVALDIAREGRPAARVGVKVRFAPFITVQRSLTLPEPTYAADVLAEAAVELLGRLDRTRAVRLVGVRAEMTAP
jgi:DNA polymerase-4